MVLNGYVCEALCSSELETGPVGRGVEHSGRWTRARHAA